MLQPGLVPGRFLFLATHTRTHGSRSFRNCSSTCHCARVYWRGRGVPVRQHLYC
jgi:hypothetical protein